MLECFSRESLQVWQEGRLQSEANNLQQKHDPELIKEVLRPGVLQEVRSHPNCHLPGLKRVRVREYRAEYGSE